MLHSKFTRATTSAMLSVCATLLQASMIMSADAAQSTVSQSIRIADLNSSKSTDVAVLYSRIRRAADAVCGPSMITGSRIPTGAQRACVTETTEQTVRKINQSPLTTYHAEQTHRAGA